MGLVQEFVEFCDHVQTRDHDENSSMTWLDSFRDGRKLLLRVGIHTGTEDVPDQVWEIGAEYTREFSLVELEFNDWTFTDHHALLWDHEEPFSQLNFAGPSSCHREVLWDLYERHRTVAGHWIPFERYMNDQFLRNSLAGGWGVLADGPLCLLREYAAVLSASDLEPYFPHPPRPAHWWDDEHHCWVEDDPKLSVLILGGTSFVVGREFFANRVD
jgi:hypothetical protein